MLCCTEKPWLHGVFSPCVVQILQCYLQLAPSFLSVQFSHSVMSDYVTPWTSARQSSLSITNCWSLPKPMSTESVMSSNHLILCHPLLLLPSLPASGSSQMCQLFASGGQSIGVSTSASVLPMNTQDWSPSGWPGWSSLQSKGLSRVFSWEDRCVKYQWSTPSQSKRT